MLRVAPKTLAKWDREGRAGLRSVRTPGGHRRYYAADVRKILDRNPGS